MINKKIVLLPCAGQGLRFASATPKQYTKIHDKTVLEHTLWAFLSVPLIDQIIIITAVDDAYIDNLLAKILVDTPADLAKIQVLKVGGATRAHSVKNAVNKLKCADSDWLLVHDVARCCITPVAILRQIAHLEHDAIGGILAIATEDTIKQSQNGQVVDMTLARSAIYQAQTPQMFRANVLRDALKYAQLDLVTDEASAVEQLGLPVKLIYGERSNIKITYPLDIKVASVILNGDL